MNLVPGIFQFVFGCRHRHLSRVFTIKHRTYRVCFDCGWEIDLPNALGIGSAEAQDHPLGDRSSSCTLNPPHFLDDIHSAVIQSSVYQHTELNKD